MLYTIAHKVTDYEEIQPGTVGLQVGNNERFLGLRDSDVEDNISEWNPVYAELTGIYYIWKNDHDEIKGSHQYRRWLPLTEGIPEGYKVRTCKPLNLSYTVRQQYSAFHSQKDLYQVTKILDAYFPEYLDTWLKVLDGHTLYYSNGFAMHGEDYDRYCRWLFGILELMKHMNQWYRPEDVSITVESEIRRGFRNGVRGLKYQSQVLAFLSERLFTLYILHNFKGRIYEDKYELKENSGI